MVKSQSQSGSPGRGKVVKTYPAEFRAQVVKVVQAGQRSFAEAAREFEVSVDSVRRWVKQAELDAGRRLRYTE